MFFNSSLKLGSSKNISVLGWVGSSWLSSYTFIGYKSACWFWGYLGYWHIKFFPGIGLYKTLFVSNWNLYFQESACVREKERGRKRRGEVAHRLLTNRGRRGSGNFLNHIVCFTFCLPSPLLLESPISMFYFHRCGPISFPYLVLLFSNISF